MRYHARPPTLSSESGTTWRPLPVQINRQTDNVYRPRTYALSLLHADASNAAAAAEKTRFASTAPRRVARTRPPLVVPPHAASGRPTASRCRLHRRRTREDIGGLHFRSPRPRTGNISVGTRTSPRRVSVPARRRRRRWHSAIPPPFAVPPASRRRPSLPFPSRFLAPERTLESLDRRERATQTLESVRTPPF